VKQKLTVFQTSKQSKVLNSDLSRNTAGFHRSVFIQPICTINVTHNLKRRVSRTMRRMWNGTEAVVIH